jgi:hypothetical protein
MAAQTHQGVRAAPLAAAAVVVTSPKEPYPARVYRIAPCLGGCPQSTPAPHVVLTGTLPALARGLGVVRGSLEVHLDGRFVTHNPCVVTWRQRHHIARADLVLAAVVHLHVHAP